MNTSNLKWENVDRYHASFPSEIRQVLDTMRALIRASAPDATEGIAYGMPAFRQRGVLVYYAAQKKHLGFYPTAEPIRVFADALEPYITSKGAIQFPYDRPLPAALIQEIVAFRVKQDALQASTAKRSKTHRADAG
jgi:uncharacterized protein YdhG (YjbR/CyaY superfamily)